MAAENGEKGGFLKVTVSSNRSLPSCYTDNPQIALLARCLNPLVLLSKAVVGWLLRGGFGALRRAAQVLKLGI